MVRVGVALKPLLVVTDVGVDSDPINLYWVRGVDHFRLRMQR